MKKSTKRKRIEKEYNLEAVTNFFLYSIQKDLIDTCTLIPDYMFYVFFNYREKFKDESFKFPNKFYETTYLIAQELSLSNSIRLKKLDYRASGFYWLVGEDKIISNETYGILWINLRFLIVNKKDDAILKYWSQAFDHFEFNLRIPDSIYSSPPSTEKVNQNEIERIEKERFEFLDFHYYLGGLLLSENRIECIRRLWDHTNSEPPRYPLLPFVMGEIFNRYFELCQIFDQKLWEKAARFTFPKVDSVNFDWIVNSWVRKYLVLLFLRQYTLQKYYIYQEFLELPNSPESQAVKKHWMDNIQMFIADLTEILTNTELLKSLRFNMINDELCQKEGKMCPLDLVNALKNQLEADFEKNKVEQRISTEKVNKFLASSKKLIEEALTEYNPILEHGKISGSQSKYNPFYIQGNKYIIPKSDFTDNQGYDPINYDSFTAESLSNKIQRVISETFLWVTTQGYLLKEEDLFPAIDCLEIVSNPTEFIIVSFRQNIEYYMSVLNVSELYADKYKNVQLIDIWNCSGHVIGGTFFILRKSDLPSLIFSDPISKVKDKYEEEEEILSNIFASVVNLHERGDLKGKLKTEGFKEDLEDKVLVSIEINAEVRWKKSAKVIAFKVASASDDKGLPNKLEEIKPFDKL